MVELKKRPKNFLMKFQNIVLKMTLKMQYQKKKIIHQIKRV